MSFDARNWETDASEGGDHEYLLEKHGHQRFVQQREQLGAGRGPRSRRCRRTDHFRRESDRQLPGHRARLKCRVRRNRGHHYFCLHGNGGNGHRCQSRSHQSRRRNWWTAELWWHLQQLGHDFGIHRRHDQCSDVRCHSQGRRPGLFAGSRRRQHHQRAGIAHPDQRR